MHREFSTEHPEFMDLPAQDCAELEKDIRALENLNIRFGAHAIIRAHLPRWLPPRESAEPYRILDLATASGDIPRMIVDWARAHGVRITVTAVDFNATTLAIARRCSASYPEIEYIHGDILQLDVEKASFDMVLCSQVLHHFSEDDAARVLAICARASRGAVLVSDLKRGRAGQFTVWLLTVLFYRSRMMKHDFRISLRRAFSTQEMRTLAIRAGWKNFCHRGFFPVRQALWIDNVQNITASARKPLDEVLQRHA